MARLEGSSARRPVAKVALAIEPPKQRKVALGLGDKLMNVNGTCAHCGSDHKSTRRDFSNQAWSALVSWGEINTKTIDQPICGECYTELREVLMDRADDLAQVSMDGNPSKSALANEKPMRGKRSSKMAS